MNDHNETKVYLFFYMFPRVDYRDSIALKFFSFCMLLTSSLHEYIRRRLRCIRFIEVVFFEALSIIYNSSDLKQDTLMYDNLD